MVLGGCLTCVKYLMFIFNFIFWLIGCIILSLGIWVLVDEKTFLTGQEAAFVEVAPYILIGIGSIILIVGFLGCCGSIRESQCMLASFFVFLLVIFAILATCGIFLIITRQYIGENIYENYKKSAKDYDTDRYKAVVDTVHAVYECCGYKDGIRDFDSYSKKPPGCTNADKSPVTEVCNQERFQAKLETIKQHALIVGLVSLGVAVVLIIGMMFSMMLCCAIRDNL